MVPNLEESSWARENSFKALQCNRHNYCLVWHRKRPTPNNFSWKVPIMLKLHFLRLAYFKTNCMNKMEIHETLGISGLDKWQTLEGRWLQHCNYCYMTSTLTMNRLIKFDIMRWVSKDYTFNTLNGSSLGIYEKQQRRWLDLKLLMGIFPTQYMQNSEKSKDLLCISFRISSFQQFCLMEYIPLHPEGSYWKKLKFPVLP